MLRKEFFHFCNDIRFCQNVPFPYSIWKGQGDYHTDEQKANNHYYSIKDAIAFVSVLLLAEVYIQVT